MTASGTPTDVAEFSRAGPEDAEELAAVTLSGDPQTLRGRLAAGRRCYVARVRGALAAYGWVSFGEEVIGEMRLRIRLLPGEAYVWDCFTAPAYRRRGLYSALLQHITAELRAEGLCRVWIGADLDNIPSQKGMALAGFSPVANLYVAGTQGWRVLWTHRSENAPARLAAEASRVMLGGRRGWMIQRLPPPLTA
jgi:GNAT superfamily N-acetyltransferase